MDDQQHSTTTTASEVAFLRLQSSLDVGITRITGQLDVILQRLDQQDKRGDDHASQLGTLDTRVDALERTAVTREDLERRQSAAARSVGIVVSVVAIVASVGTSVLIAALT